MRTTTSYSFYCRESKTDKKGLAPIELGISINGTRKFLNLPFKCDPFDFNRKRRPQYIQEYLDTQRIRIATIVTDLAKEGTPLTADSLREYLRLGGVRSYTIGKLFDDYFVILRKKVGVTITEGVYNKYIRVQRLFSQYIDFSKECNAITPAVIEDFYTELRSKYEDSTSCGMMTKLKTVIKFGMDNNKIHTNPFQSVKIAKGVKDIETITLSQLRAIIDHEFLPRVQKVADMFIFACGSGLSFADCIALQPGDFSIHDGKLCIFKGRAKTGVKFYSVLLPWAVDIYNKYQGDFTSLKISNQKTNMYLKEIQDVTGINLNLHFHLARHFYAMYLLNKKVPVTTLQRAIGHSQITQTMHYAKALEGTIIDDISKII